MDFCDLLKHHRLRVGLTSQIDLAREMERIGMPISRVTVSDWESGNKRPERKRMPALIRSLRLNKSERRRFVDAWLN